tara:strand:- start:1031 stop:1267 length:237 start_codon:yes stop_codon:yes gene_type:complete
MNVKEIIDIIYKSKKIIAKNKIKPSSNIVKDLNFDSLEYMTLVSRIEKKIKKKLDNYNIDWRKFNSANNIYKILKKIK